MPEFNNIVSAGIGVHDLVASEVKKNVSLGSKVIDLGCGEGKVLYQLDGYDRTGVDFENNFRLDLPFSEVNLNINVPFSEESFDGVVSSEVIEHLENPWHFTREIARILKLGGIAVITTPNVNSLLSRIGYLRKGLLRMFEDEHYKEWGHITPLTNWQLRKTFERAGLEVINWQYNFKGFVGDWKQVLFQKIVSIYPFKGELGGDINIITLKKV